MPAPIQQNILNHDLSARIQQYKTVDASPALAAETVIATLTLADFGNIAVTSGVFLEGWAAFTVGTSGVTATMRLRQTNVAGSVVVSSGALTVVAGNLVTVSVNGFDAAPGIAAYALTLTIGSGAAASTVSALQIAATVV
jgi:hypothetical protein